jgi:hypothetical protein
VLLGFLFRILDTTTETHDDYARCLTLDALVLVVVSKSFDVCRCFT